MTATIAESFQRIAARFPDRTACSDDESVSSYRELDLESDRIAAELRSCGIRAQMLVAVEMDRSTQTVCVFLAILKCGAAYLALDPNYPDSVKTTQLRLSGAQFIMRSSAGPAEVAPGATANSLPVDTAYMIFTSGSTGLPKPVIVSNSNVLALLDACSTRFSISPADRWSVCHSFSFDFSVWELFGCLLSAGHAVIVSTADVRDSYKLLARLRASGVTVLSQVPSSLGYLLLAAEDAVEDAASLVTTRYVVLGGEAIDPAVLRRWVSAGVTPNAALINMYGITETTVHATFKELADSDLETRANGGTPIGRALGHLQIKVVDNELRERAPGTVGELLLIGPGVSFGYWNNPEYTAEKFVVSQWGRAYRSGDHGYVGELGELFYIGRQDSQVKIRGFRIEMAEVEATIQSTGLVSAVAVIKDSSAIGEPLLAAHYVPRGEVGTDELRLALSGALPPQSIPSRFVAHRQLPLTPQGKVDRSRLSQRFPDRP